MGIWLQLTMIQPENHQDENRHCTPPCCALPASFTQTKVSSTNHNIYTNKTVVNKPQHLHKQNCRQQTTTLTQTKLSSTNHNIYTNKTVANKPQHLHKQNCRQQTTIFTQTKLSSTNHNIYTKQNCRQQTTTKNLILMHTCSETDLVFSEFEMSL